MRRETEIVRSKRQKVRSKKSSLLRLSSTVNFESERKKDKRNRTRITRIVRIFTDLIRDNLLNLPAVGRSVSSAFYCELI
jgi:hypothetical protein